VHLGLPVRSNLRGTGTAQVLLTVSIEAMNKHLAEISTCVSARAIALLTCEFRFNPAGD